MEDDDDDQCVKPLVIDTGTFTTATASAVAESQQVDRFTGTLETQGCVTAAQSADHIMEQAEGTTAEGTPLALGEPYTTSEATRRELSSAATSPAVGSEQFCNEEEENEDDRGGEYESDGHGNNDESVASPSDSSSQSSVTLASSSSPSKDLLLTGSGSGGDLSPGSAGGSTPRGSKSRRKADRVRNYLIIYFTYLLTYLL